MNSTPSSIHLRIAFSLFSFFITGSSGWFPVGAQEVKWESDLNQAISIAEKENKLVLLHFTASWSKSSREIQTFVFSSPPVQRAIQSNVVPVRIDVDEQPELTSQYGVGNVPYDIVITPAKRIISRRQSPKDAANYALLIQRLEKTIQQITESGSTKFNQNLDDFQQLMKPGEVSREQSDLTPDGPSHQAAPPSQDSQELNRKAISMRPPMASPMASPMSSQELLSNPVRPTIKEPRAEPTTTSRPSSLGPLRIVNPNFVANDAKEGPANPLVNATMQPNLKRPPATKSATDSGNGLSQRFLPNVTAQATEFQNAEVRVSAGASAIPAILNATEGDQTDTGMELALKGKCPVTLIKEGRWSEGSTQWGCVHRERTYLFSSEENLKNFLADPDAFSPLLAGYDPVVYEQSAKLVPGDVEHGVFMGKAPHIRIVLFSDRNTRREFEANPKKYIETIRQAMKKSGASSSKIQ